MLQIVTTIVKWVSIPVLLIASMFSYLAASYEASLVEFVILGAIVFLERAVRLKEYSWAWGLVAIVLVFSPLLLTAKIFFLMGLTCLFVFTTLMTAFRPQPLAAE
jgi:hypothetical protein